MINFSFIFSIKNSYSCTTSLLRTVLLLVWQIWIIVKLLQKRWEWILNPFLWQEQLVCVGLMGCNAWYLNTKKRSILFYIHSCAFVNLRCNQIRSKNLLLTPLITYCIQDNWFHASSFYMPFICGLFHRIVPSSPMET